eukprot:4707300-Prymnesium_polylepis.1
MMPVQHCHTSSCMLLFSRSSHSLFLAIEHKWNRETARKILRSASLCWIGREPGASHSQLEGVRREILKIPAK